MCDDDLTFVDMAMKTLDIEIDSLCALKYKFTKDFNELCSLILSSYSRVIVCGMGKSGLIGRKISATLSSTGTPSFFMHPAEAFHGDLGMVKSEDIFLVLSNSGETEELLKLLPFIKKNGNVLASFTGNCDSTLALASNYHIDVSVEKEACPLKLAPTSSTTACLAMGDALAVAIMESRGFKEENFARFHPGGSLGRRLLTSVRDEMETKMLPLLPESGSFTDLISVMSSCGYGLAVIVDVYQNVMGLITDGDLRRAIEKYKSEVFDISPLQIMSKSPISVSSKDMIVQAENLMKSSKITKILVIDDSKLIGILKK